jgi:spore coat polysaccharide biosynthesis predicted glycosyltransferase SpsG
MRFLLRADAGVEAGTGHVMRCLALGEELLDRGHRVRVMGDIGVDWLADQIRFMGIEHVPGAPDELDDEAIVRAGYDAVVVDSYRIPVDAIGRLDGRVPVLAVIDGDDRGIRAHRYLDQNHSAETLPHDPWVAERLMAGSPYGLVRREIRRLRREDGWRLPRRPNVLAFMGGSDPMGAMPRIVAGLRALPDDARTTVVAAPPWRADVATLLAGREGARIVDPTPRLPDLLGAADIVISAAGTSAWDICTIGIPAVFCAVVRNQEKGLAAIVESGVGVGVDAIDHPGELEGIGALVAALLRDEITRRSLVTRSLQTFDGHGAERVADELEKLC